MAIPYELLESFHSPGVFNPWRDTDPLDRSDDGDDALGPAGRRARLRAHFSIKPRFVLLGEAPGYQGCHFSGIPFTNEKLLLAGAVPRVAVHGRLTNRSRPWCEPSATVVWGALHRLGIAEDTVLWNTFAWHPYKDGQPYSNRAPTRLELELGRTVLAGVLDSFQGACVVAVGKVAERTLGLLDRPATTTLRHPSMGGANEFREGLARLVRAHHHAVSA